MRVYEVKNATLVRSRRTAIYILNNPSYRCGRKDRWNPIRELGYQTEAAEEFFNDWPMYMDGIEHQSRRRDVIKALATIKEINYRPAIKELQKSFADNLIDGLAIENIVKAWHREVFGLSISQQKEFFKLAKPLFDFFDPNKRLESLHLLNSCIPQIHLWFQKTKFSRSSLISEMRNQDLQVNTQLNLILDTYTPMLSALGILTLELATIIEQYGNNKNIIPKVIVKKCLRKYPPFRLINRERSIDDKIFSIDILACNNQNKNINSKKTCPNIGTDFLTFGYGDHYCPGSRLVFSFLNLITQRSLQLYKSSKIDLVKGKIISGPTNSRVDELEIIFKSLNS